VTVAKMRGTGPGDEAGEIRASGVRAAIRLARKWAGTYSALGGGTVRETLGGADVVDENGKVIRRFRGSKN
jgi:hypothetical protein